MAQITLFGPFGTSNKLEFYKKVQVKHKSGNLKSNFSKLLGFAIPLSLSLQRLVTVINSHANIL